MSNLEAILNEYNKNSTPTSGSSGAKKIDLSNYFSTHLEKGVNEATKTIRILPGREGETPFPVIYYHSKKVDGKYPKFQCPKEMDGEACPFCEAYTILMAKNTEDDRKLAYQYKAKQAYALKVIDRDKESEGVKFWRINHSYKKEGVYDKIISLIKAYRKDLTDPKEGMDLQLMINRTQQGYPTVSNIIASISGPTPLSSDSSKMELWLNDIRTWRDVYSVKSYDYLFILVEGDEPMWDKDKKKYVGKNAAAESPSQQSSDSNDDYKALDDELVVGGGTATTETPAAATATTETPAVTKKETPVKEEEVVDEDDDDDDLPF